MRALLVRVRALLRRDAAEGELDEELRYHLDREVERNVARGMSATEARYAARRAFGNVSNLKEQVRDSWGLRWLEQLRQDTQFALRGFKRSPAFVTTVVATIAIALGLNTTAFTIFNAYVLRPIQVRDPYSLYQFRYFDQRGRRHGNTWDEYESVRALRPGAESFAYHHIFARVDGLPMFGALVTGETFQVLSAPVELGRALLPEDASLPNGSAVIVLSYDAWRSRFGGDTGIVGRSVVVRGVPLTVVGILAKQFQGISSLPPDFWAPVTLINRFEGSGLLGGAQQAELLRIVVRLAPRETLAAARAQLGTWAARAASTRPDSLKPSSVELTSLASALPKEDAETWAMFAPILVAFGLVLLIACANIANVMLARGIARQREIGIRLALGADRARLIRQLLTESVLLAIPAAMIGFLISRWSIDAGTRAMFASVPGDFAPYLRVIPLVPDARVFAFILVIAVAAALLFGLIPAVQTTRPNIVQASRGDFDTAFRPGRLRGALLVAQITVCALLLISTGILLRGAEKARRTETGIHADNVLHIQLDERTRAAGLAQLKGHPLVRDIAGSSSAPLDGVYPTLAVRGMAHSSEQAAYNLVSDKFFDVLGIAMTHGRAFTEAETRAGAQVAVVSEAFAQRLWPGRDPIGQLIQITSDVPRGSNLDGMRTTRVIGVARNAVSGWIGTGLERPVVYYPKPLTDGGMRILTRVIGNETQARARLDLDVQTAIARSPIEEMHTLNDFVAVQVYPFRAFSWVSSALGGIALLLTLAGIYGVLSYLVTQRTKEIGIRMALGASVPAVVRMVVRQSFLLAITGIAIGAVLSLAASRLFESVLVVVNTFDVVGYASGTAVVLAAALAASFAPARRAARVDPMRALREE